MSIYDITKSTTTDYENNLDEIIVSPVNTDGVGDSKDDEKTA